jgi:hypothetical protein
MVRRRAGVQTARALLEQTAAEVASLPGPALRAIGPVLFQAERELAQDLAKWLRTVENGAARFGAQQYRVALVQIRQALRTAKGLNPALFDVLNSAGAEAGSLALGHLARQAEQFSMLFEGSLRPMPIRPAAVLAEGRKALIPRFRASAQRYGDHVTRDIQRELAVGVARGETFDQLTRRLMRHGGPKGMVTVRGIEGDRGAVSEHIAEGLFRRYRSRAATVVRTETINAYNVVAHDALAEAHAEDPGYLKRWDAALDWRLCKLCRSLDGQTAKVSGRFAGGYEHPPAHPNCFPAGTTVLTARGHVAIESVEVGDLVWTHRMRWRPVVALSRQHTTGGLVALEWRGHVVRTTPNHPFATPRGWVDAEDLGIAGAQPYVLEGVSLVAHDSPPERHEHGLLGVVLREFAPAAVPAAAVHFDGHHERRQRHVDVELAHGERGHRAEMRERRAQGGLGGRIAAALAYLGHAFEHLMGLRLAAHGRVGAGHLGQPLCWAHRRIASGIVGGGVSHHAVGMEDAIDGAAAASVALGERDGSLAREVEGNEFRLRQVMSLRHGKVVRSNPVLTRVAFVGAVYNFQVADDESYVAGGFVVHNCRCALTPWHEEWGTSVRSAPPEPIVKTESEAEKKRAAHEAEVRRRVAEQEEARRAREAELERRREEERRRLEAEARERATKEAAARALAMRGPSAEAHLQAAGRSAAEQAVAGHERPGARDLPWPQPDHAAGVPR